MLRFIRTGRNTKMPPVEGDQRQLVLPARIIDAKQLLRVSGHDALLVGCLVCTSYPKVLVISGDRPATGGLALRVPCRRLWGKVCTKVNDRRIAGALLLCIRITFAGECCEEWG